MAQVLKVQQVPSSPLNGLPAVSEKNGHGLTIEKETSPTPTHTTASAGLTHIQNGAVLFHGTPTKDLNGASTSIESDDLQLSPGGDLRRRSTRASALKAQEKIKLKDDIVQGPQKRLNEQDEMEMDENPDDDDTMMQSSAKKRRLEDGRQFDQTCFRFGLRANDEGEVYAMTDESENSSIHESEMEIVRYHYEKMKNKEPDEEQLRERLKMRREAENALREEEAKLLVLRKMKDSQNRAITKLAAETKAADLAESASATAYKPVVANPGAKNAANTNGKNAISVLSTLSTQQQLDLLGKLASQSPAAKQAYQLAKKNPTQTTAIFHQLINLNNAQQKQKEAAAAAAEAAMAVSNNTATPQQHQQVQITQQKILNQQTPAQRIQAARLAFRAQADKQLMTIPTQKTQPHDITFLPNPNASAFLALHGLDLVVQQVLKDRTNEKRYDGPPYECEECKTDCAHTWKAIGSSPEELHLYCENCVRSAQKRKNRTDQTNLLKRAFQKISAQEKEFEKKIAEGQLEMFAEAKAAAPAASSTPSIPTSSTATVSSTPLGPRLPNMPSSSGTSTPTQAIKSSTPLPSTPKSSSSASKKASLPQGNPQMNLLMQQMLQNNPMMRNQNVMQQMQQMMQMYQMAQAAQQVQAAQQAARNMPSMQNLQQNQMAMLLVQQAHAQQQAAAQAQAKSARESAQQQQAQQQAQQAQQAVLIAALLQQTGMSGMNQQALQKLTPTQQKAVIEMFKKSAKK